MSMGPSSGQRDVWGSLLQVVWGGFLKEGFSSYIEDTYEKSLVFWALDIDVQAYDT